MRYIARAERHRMTQIANEHRLPVRMRIYMHLRGTVLFWRMMMMLTFDCAHVLKHHVLR